MIRLHLALMILGILVVTIVQQAPTYAASPVGKWKGTWTSQKSGHSGPLRARIRQLDSTTYRAVFAGRFAYVIPFVYPAKLKADPNCRSPLTSSQRLPLLGEYHMSAAVSQGKFTATFNGRSDSGQFQMSRK